MEFLSVARGKTAERYREMLRKYVEEPLPTIHDVYKRPSEAKKSAYDNCAFYAFDYVDFLKSKGYKARIIDWGVISHNTSFFTFASLIKLSYEEMGLSETYVAVVMTPKRAFEVVI